MGILERINIPQNVKLGANPAPAESNTGKETPPKPEESWKHTFYSQIRTVIPKPQSPNAPASKSSPPEKEVVSVLKTLWDGGDNMPELMSSIETIPDEIGDFYSQVRQVRASLPTPKVEDPTREPVIALKKLMWL